MLVKKDNETVLLLKEEGNDWGLKIHDGSNFPLINTNLGSRWSYSSNQMRQLAKDLEQLAKDLNQAADELDAGTLWSGPEEEPEGEVIMRDGKRYKLVEVK